jgi:hypothetical protein
MFRGALDQVAAVSDVEGVEFGAVVRGVAVLAAQLVEPAATNTRDAEPIDLPAWPKREMKVVN